MLRLKVVSKSTLLFYIIVAVLFLASIAIIATHPEDVTAAIATTHEFEQILANLFEMRNAGVLTCNTDALKSLFLTEERNGLWAYELEVQRAQYLRDWSVKQGVTVTDINSTLVIKRIKQVGRGYAFFVLSSDEYRYVYHGDDTENVFRLGSYHSIDLIPNGHGGWIISREWYDDPLSDKLGDCDADITAYIAAQTRPDLSDLSEARMAAVGYADMFCGATSDGSTNYEYNKDYTNFNAQGGDCANFASQVLHEGGGFRKNKTWNYLNGKGSRAWVNAQAFKDYWLYSGNATLIANGKYENVYRQAYQLRPGDIIAYAKKNKVSHISVVTALDSKGYPLVNCHNADRWHVPWDIGWSRSNVRFYLIRVHY